MWLNWTEVSWLKKLALLLCLHIYHHTTVYLSILSLHFTGAQIKNITDSKSTASHSKKLECLRAKRTAALVLVDGDCWEWSKFSHRAGGTVLFCSSRKGTLKLTLDVHDHTTKLKRGGTPGIRRHPIQFKAFLTLATLCFSGCILMCNGNTMDVFCFIVSKFCQNFILTYLVPFKTESIMTYKRCKLLNVQLQPCGWFHVTVSSAMMKGSKTEERRFCDWCLWCCSDISKHRKCSETHTHWTGSEADIISITSSRQVKQKRSQIRMCFFHPTTNLSVPSLLWLLSDLCISPRTYQREQSWHLTAHATQHTLVTEAFVWHTYTRYITRNVCLRALPNILLTHSFSCFMCMYVSCAMGVAMFACGAVRVCVHDCTVHVLCCLPCHLKQCWHFAVVTSWHSSVDVMY